MTREKLTLILLALMTAAPLWARETVLISGFDPFGGSSDNNSWRIAQALKAELPEVDIVTCLLPTSYARSMPALEECLKTLPAPPDLLISLGEGPCRVKWETRAHNRDHDRGPDNDGVSRRRRTIDPTGPRELGLRLNYAAMWCALEESEKKLVQVSTSPDNFVCNHTAYRTGLLLPEMIYGFVHVPSTRCETQTPGITIASVKLVAKMIRTQLTTLDAHSSRIEWPTRQNSVRLASEARDVRALRSQASEDCESEFLQQWIRGF